MTLQLYNKETRNIISILIYLVHTNDDLYSKTTFLALLNRNGVFCPYNALLEFLVFHGVCGKSQNIGT